jgi:hypothetical protein
MGRAGASTMAYPFVVSVTTAPTGGLASRRWCIGRRGCALAYLLGSEIVRPVIVNCEVETLSTSTIAVANTNPNVWIEGRVTSQVTQWVVTRSHRNETTISYTSGRRQHSVVSSRLVHRSLCGKSRHSHDTHLLSDVEFNGHSKETTW